MMTDNDREQRLQELADENARLADAELHLIETIQEHQRKLIELPDIIRQLEMKRERVTAEMERAGAEHDALHDALMAELRAEAKRRVEAEHRRELEKAYDEAYLAAQVGKDFVDRANDMADDYADHQLAVQPPVGW